MLSPSRYRVVYHSFANTIVGRIIGNALLPNIHYLTGSKNKRILDLKKNLALKLLHLKALKLRGINAKINTKLRELKKLVASPCTQSLFLKSPTKTTITRNIDRPIYVFFYFLFYHPTRWHRWRTL